jgi:hypothetical protein
VENFQVAIARFSRGEHTMGFGHRVYRNYDPRAKIIKIPIGTGGEITAGCASLHRSAMMLSMKRKVAIVRTLKQARVYILQVGVCGIFSDAGVGMPNLWEVVDLPDRQPGEKGWGQKVVAIWRWKNELPAIYPEEIFYGKIPAGRAVLMSMDYLRVEHYPKHHRPLRECSALAQKIYERLRLDPLTTGSLREELNMTLRPERNRFDRALQELQVTLNIARRNSLEDENDTWVLFSDQYLEVVHVGNLSL